MKEALRQQIIQEEHQKREQELKEAMQKKILEEEF